MAKQQFSKLVMGLTLHSGQWVLLTQHFWPNAHISDGQNLNFNSVKVNLNTINSRDKSPNIMLAFFLLVR